MLLEHNNKKDCTGAIHYSFPFKHLKEKQSWKYFFGRYWNTSL